jgi:hypothetical protein
MLCYSITYVVTRVVTALSIAASPKCTPTPGLAISLFREVAVNLSIWSRPDRASLRRLFRHLTRGGFEGSGTEAPAGAIQLEDLVPVVPPRLIALRRALLRDIGELCKLYADHAGSGPIRVKFEIESTDRCKYFHTDNIGLRLLCTYEGPGTEWLADSAVDRSALHRGSNDGVIVDPAGIRRLGPGSVGLFKGDACPGFSGRGCVHRSPPIEHLRQRRVLLSIDRPVDD